MASRITTLLVILLGLSQLIFCLHAVPATRTSQLEDQAYEVSENTHLGNADEASKMDLEINDYPGSGANNRHTPKPPQRCGDCRR